MHPTILEGLKQLYYSTTYEYNIPFFAGTATTVSSLIDLREKSRFSPFYYSYSKPLRERGDDALRPRGVRQLCIRHGARVTCAHVGCDKPSHQGGFCSSHPEMDRCGDGGPPTASGRVDRAAGMVLRTAATRGAQARSSREDVARDTTARGLSHPPRQAKRSAPPSRSRAKSAD